MRPTDPTAVAKRFAKVVARGIARAKKEDAEHLARLRAVPTEHESADSPPWIDEAATLTLSSGDVDLLVHRTALR
jgi:hypothetical protein